ncbi:hypothetical protein Psuf_061680 [Phytohabitans suffuscus]|uniref:Uncharacterized protein n=1 Tax=Phytohabitans suffuscus TaxID=624315 RepID=A0A6F8YRP4_9ACTN|nr:hypothetical protein Psuf_061680 [Phytohabitans suffuscus]
MVAVAAAVAVTARLNVGAAAAVASLRAAVQLAAVSAVIVVVLRSWGLTAAFVAVMLVIASVTSARRIGGRAVLACVAVTAGAMPVLALLMVSGAVPLKPIAVVPIAGIFVGGAMTATTLAGRRTMDILRTRRRDRGGDGGWVHRP